MTIKLNDLSDADMKAVDSFIKTQKRFHDMGWSMAEADKKRKANNVVSHPSHYASGGIECKDAMAAAMAPGYDFDPMEGAEFLRLTPMAFYWWGCAFKYLWRWDKKNGIEDLQKCKQCIDFLIEEIGKE